MYKKFPAQVQVGVKPNMGLAPTAKCEVGDQLQSCNCFRLVHTPLDVDITPTLSPHMHLILTLHPYPPKVGTNSVREPRGRTLASRHVR